MLELNKKFLDIIKKKMPKDKAFITVIKKLKDQRKKAVKAGKYIEN